MAAPVIDRMNTKIRHTSGGAEALGATPGEHTLLQPMPRFAAVVRVLVWAYIAAIFALVVLRGIDAALHG
ncbi:MAG TPA: hypothetical protein VN802_16385 [Stellaceae bacterium]|nr:hypothetical protein [Stellaceae bacterium]